MVAVHTNNICPDDHEFIPDPDFIDDTDSDDAHTPDNGQNLDFEQGPNDEQKPDIPQKKTYLIHLSLLCKNSLMLQKALSGPFRESQELQIHLQEYADTFGIFATWMYNPTLKPLVVIPEIWSGRGYLLLARCYAMAERLIADEFQQAVYEEFRRIRGFTSDEFKGFSNYTGIRMLQVASEEIPQRNWADLYQNDDPVREMIFAVEARYFKFNLAHPIVDHTDTIGLALENMSEALLGIALALYNKTPWAIGDFEPCPRLPNHLPARPTPGAKRAMLDLDSSDHRGLGDGSKDKPIIIE